MARKNKKINIKLSKNDFDSSLLPTTRRAQFKDILNHEYRTLLLLGMWLLIFAIPFIFLQSFSNIFIYTYLNKNGGGLTLEEAKSFELTVTIFKDILLIVTYMIFSIGLAGSIRIIRNLVYGEVIFFKNDFILGIKKYWKIALFNSFVFGLFKGSTNVLSYLVNNYGSYEYLHLLNGFAIGFFYILIIPIIYFAVSLSITYELTFLKTFTISLRFTLVNLLISLAFSSILFAMSFIYYIGILLVVDLILIISIVFICPLYILIWHLFVTSKFDKFINEKQFPAIYKKGLIKGE